MVTRGSGLGTFMEMVRTRLQELGHEDLRQRLVEHARTLPKNDRKAFLDMLSDSAEPHPRLSGYDHPLVMEVSDFLQKLDGGHFLHGYRWDPDLHEERAFGDESWVGRMDGLFERAYEAFLGGDAQLAARALGPMLRSLHSQNGFCGRKDPQSMLATDVGEAKARYLRSLYMCTPPDQRVERLLEAVQATWKVGRPGTGLDRIGDADEAPLPDVQAFLPAWKRALEEADSTCEPEARREIRTLLREALIMSGGLAELSGLAARSGADHPEIHHELAVRLALGGRMEEAARAASAGIEAIRDPSERARLADLLVSLAVQERDHSLALTAARRAWSSHPRPERLVSLYGIGASNMDVSIARMREEAARFPADAGEAPNQLGALTEMLAALYPQASARLEASPPLGWSFGDHPGPIILPFVLLASSGQGEPPMGSSMAVLMGAVDETVARTCQASWKPTIAEEFGQGQLSLPDPASGTTLAGLLVATVRHRPAGDRIRMDLLDRACALVHRRVESIVRGRHRTAYRRGALLATSCAEAHVCAGRGDEGDRLLLDIASKFEGHPSFRRELSNLVNTSPVLRTRPLPGHL